jgi:hypothetical protein
MENTERVDDVIERNNTCKQTYVEQDKENDLAFCLHGK